MVKSANFHSPENCAKSLQIFGPSVHELPIRSCESAGGSVCITWLQLQPIGSRLCECSLGGQADSVLAGCPGHNHTKHHNKVFTSFSMQNLSRVLSWSRSLTSDEAPGSFWVTICISRIRVRFWKTGKVSASWDGLKFNSDYLNYLKLFCSKMFTMEWSYKSDRQPRLVVVVVGEWEGGMRISVRVLGEKEVQV